MTPHRCLHPRGLQYFEAQGRAEVRRCGLCGTEVPAPFPVPLRALAPGLALLAAFALALALGWLP